MPPVTSMTLCGRMLWNILSLTFLAMLERCARKTLGPGWSVVLGVLWEKAGLQRGPIMTLSERPWSSAGSGEVNASWLSVPAGSSTGLGSHGPAHSGHAGRQARGEGMGFSLARRPPNQPSDQRPQKTRQVGKHRATWVLVFVSFGACPSRLPFCTAQD